MIKELLERTVSERFSERSSRERVSRERRTIEGFGRERTSTRLFDDRPERTQSGTERWRIMRPPEQRDALLDVPIFKSPPYRDAWDPQGQQLRMSRGLFPAPLWAGGGVPPPSESEVPEVRRDGPIFFRDRNFYGSYFGWGSSSQYPRSPVDLVAWYHDQEYGAIQEKYGANPNPEKAWFEPFSRFDRPEFMYDLAMADLRFNENSWTFIGQGLDQGFYKGAPALLAADILMSTVAMAFHSNLAIARLAVYGLQVVGGGLWKVIHGEISVGDYLQSIMAGSAKILAAAGYLVAGTVRGIWSFGTAGLRAIARDPARGLGGAVIGGFIGGPVGAIFGGIVSAGGGGCFISTAACQVHSLPDDHELLRDLRAFRDQYMTQDWATRALVEFYYQLSPAIVAELARRPDKDRIYGGLMIEYIVPALESIRRGRYREGLRQYAALLTKAASLAGLRHRIGKFPAVDRYRLLADSDPMTR